MRRGANSPLANPVLVGAVTILVTLVAVFLAYNANNGLPFVPTTALKVRLTNGANLVKGNEVRVGGYRSGVITATEPVALPDGSTGAELTLKLDKKVGEVPRDSSAVVRSRSSLGLKYLDLKLGSSAQRFADGDTMQADVTEVPVDLDEVYNMFDEDTREASQRNLEGFGDAFAGRGPSLGLALEELPGFFGFLEPVMRNLSAPETGLDEFFVELGNVARIVRPVSEINAKTFTTMADTFAALGRDEAALQSFISKSPPTMDASIESFRVQRPFLDEFAEFSEDFAGATKELRVALPTLNRAVAKGIPVQRRMPALNERLADALEGLREVSEPAASTGAARGLADFVGSLNPQIRFYGPYVTVCNGTNYFLTYLAEHFSEIDSTGQMQRALLNSAGTQDDSLGSQGANGAANGEDVRRGNAQFQHGQDMARAVTDDGRADCENGQRGYLYRNSRFSPAGENIARDPRNPGAQGPTFTGRARVPEGQTFAPIPETGPWSLESVVPRSEFGNER